MDPMLDIPKDRKPTKAGRLCLLLALVALLYLLLAAGHPTTADVVGHFRSP